MHKDVSGTVRAAAACVVEGTMHKDVSGTVRASGRVCGRGHDAQGRAWHRAGCGRVCGRGHHAQGLTFPHPRAAWVEGKVFVVRLGAGRFEVWPSTASADGLEVAAVGYVANPVEIDPLAGPSDRGTGALLAGAYRKWGPDLAGRVTGEYTAVIWDPVRASATVVHDVLGLRPVLYSISGDFVHVSSDLEQLVARVGGARSTKTTSPTSSSPASTWDHELPSLTSGASCRASRSPGPVASSGPGTSHFPKPSRSSATTTSNGCGRSTTEAVSSAVPHRGTFWCELSGGLDSATVLRTARGAVAARWGPSRSSIRVRRLPTSRHGYASSSMGPRWTGTPSTPTSAARSGSCRRPTRGEPSFAMLEAGWNERYREALPAGVQMWYVVLTCLKARHELFGTQKSRVPATSPISWPTAGGGS